MASVYGTPVFGSGGDAESYEITLPADVEEDMVILIIIAAEYDVHSPYKPDAIPGFTREDETGGGLRRTQLGYYTKKADGTEGGTTVTFTPSNLTLANDDYVWCAMAVANVPASSYFVVGANPMSMSSLDDNVPANTSAADDSLAIACVAFDGGDAVIEYTFFETGEWTELDFVVASEGEADSVGLLIAYREGVDNTEDTGYVTVDLVSGNNDGGYGDIILISGGEEGVVPTKNPPTSGEYHYDSLQSWILANEEVTSTEVVGMLNEINETDGVGYGDARRTYLDE